MTATIVAPLLALALAQAPPTFVAGMKRTIPIDAIGNPSSITRIVSGDVSGDLRPDTLMRASGVAGGEIWISFSSDVYLAVEQVPTAACGLQVRDIDLLPMAGGGAQLLVVGGPNPGGALRRVWFTKDHPWDAKSFQYAVVTPDPGWSASSGVRVAALDGVARDDLIGFSGGNIHVLLNVNGVPSLGMFGVQPSGLGTILEAVALPRSGQFDAIAIRRQKGVQIYELNLQNMTGSLLREWSFGANSLVDDLQPVTCFNAAGDLESRVAIALRPTASAPRSLKVGRLDGTFAAETALGNTYAVQFASGDGDRDGDDDVIAICPAAWTAYCFDNRTDVIEYPGGSHKNDPFSFDNMTLYNYGPPTPPPPALPNINPAEPRIVDLEGDGDVDVVLGDLAEKLLVLQRNSGINEVASWVGIVTEDDDGDAEDEEAQCAFTQDRSGNWTEHLVFTPVKPPDWDGSTFNQLEIRVWRQDHSEADATPGPADVLLVPISGTNWPDHVPYEFHETPIDPEHPDLGFAAVFTFEMRLVAYNGGTVTAAGPTSLYTYSPEPNAFLMLLTRAVEMPNYDDHGWPEPAYDDSRALLLGGFLPSAFAPKKAGGTGSHP